MTPVTKSKWDVILLEREMRATHSHSMPLGKKKWDGKPIFLMKEDVVLQT